MDLIDFFNSEVMHVPTSWYDVDNNFVQFIRSKFNDYLNLVIQLDTSDLISTEIKNSLPVIQQLCSLIEDVLETYFNGKTFGAQKIMNNLLNMHKTHITNLNSPTFSEIDFLYRIRISNEYQLEPKEIFHIPFQQRHLLSPYRYSMAGLPCLYLGASSFICWIELGRPSTKNCLISKFTVDNISLLDFGIRPAYIATILDHDFSDALKYKNWMVSQAVLFPLILVCSIEKRFTNAAFNIEYIIPQMLLQWMTENKIADGIRYFSTKYASYSPDYTPFNNFCFPVTTNNSIGYCTNLKNKFSLTHPINWEFAIKTKMLHGRCPNRANVELAATINDNTSYFNSEFYNIEAILGGLPATKLV